MFRDPVQILEFILILSKASTVFRWESIYMGSHKAWSSLWTKSMPYSSQLPFSQSAFRTSSFHSCIHSLTYLLQSIRHPTLFTARWMNVNRTKDPSWGMCNVGDYRQGNNDYSKATVIEVTSRQLEQKKEILYCLKRSRQAKISDMFPGGQVAMGQVEESTAVGNSVCQLS